MIVIPVGDLTSLTSLYRNVGKWRHTLRSTAKEWLAKADRSGNKEDFPLRWKLDELPAKGVNLPALTAFLSYAYLVSSNFKESIPTMLRYDEYLNSFLNHISFFSIAKEKNILFYNEMIIEGKREIRDHFNPAKIILIDGNYKNVNYNDTSELHKLKSIVLDKKKHEIETKILDLFIDKDLDYIHPEFIQHLSELSAEISSNSLIHGGSAAFIGMQRIESWVNKKLRIIICISDNGVGFLKSFTKSQPWATNIGINSNLDAIYNACMITKSYEPGLRDVIGQVVNDYTGYVNICSMESEIHWSKESWDSANTIFKQDISQTIIQKASVALKNTSIARQEEYRRGFYRIHKDFLPGTRVTFELNIDIL